MTDAKKDRTNLKHFDVAAPLEEAEAIEKYCIMNQLSISGFFRESAKEKREKEKSIVKEKPTGRNMLSMKLKIETLCSMSGISVTELAARFGTTQQNFAKRLKVGKFTQEELIEIAEAVGAEYYSGFKLPDGNEIQ